MVLVGYEGETTPKLRIMGESAAGTVSDLVETFDLIERRRQSDASGGH